MRGCYNRRLSGFENDDWKYIFKVNHFLSTMICVANNIRAKTSHPHRHRLTESLPWRKKKSKVEKLCDRIRDWLRSASAARLSLASPAGSLQKVCTTQGVDESTQFCFHIATPHKQVCVRSAAKTKRCRFIDISLLRFFCGKRGIRTPGPVKINGFQDRRIRPLCHLSRRKGTTFFRLCKFFLKKLKFKVKFYTFVGWKCNVITQVEKVDIWGADEIRVIRGVRVVRGDTLTIDGFDEMDDF